VKNYFNEVHATLGGTRVSENVFTSSGNYCMIIPIFVNKKGFGKQTNKSGTYKILKKYL